VRRELIVGPWAGYRVRKARKMETKARAVDGVRGERKPNMGYQEIDAIDGLWYGLSVGADILCEQCLAGPISRIGSAMGRGLETALQ
jgi:hypothetical protein